MLDVEVLPVSLCVQDSTVCARVPGWFHAATAGYECWSSTQVLVQRNEATDMPNQQKLLALLAKQASAAIWLVCVPVRTSTIEISQQLCRQYGQRLQWVAPSQHASHGDAAVLHSQRAGRHKPVVRLGAVMHFPHSGWDSFTTCTSSAVTVSTVLKVCLQQCTGALLAANVLDLCLQQRPSRLQCCCKCTHTENSVTSKVPVSYTNNNLPSAPPPCLSSAAVLLPVPPVASA